MTLAWWLGSAVLVLSLWRWSLGSATHARAATVQVTLAVLAVAFNVVVPISNVEASTLVVVCAAVTLGLRPALVVAILCVLGTDAVSGLGAWTLWQVIGLAVVGLLAQLGGEVWRVVPDCLQPLRESAPRMLAFAVWVAALTLVYDVVVTAGTLSTLGPAGAPATVSVLWSSLLLGLPFTLTHMVSNALLTFVGAPPLLRALQRARVLLPRASHPFNAR